MRGSARSGQILLDAVILLPALEGVVKIHRLPFGVSIGHQPVNVFVDQLGELAHGLTVKIAEVIRHQNGFDRGRRNRIGLPGVSAGGDFRRRIKLQDTLVGDRNECQVVRGLDLLGEKLNRIAGHVEHGIDASIFQSVQRLVRADGQLLSWFHPGYLEQKLGGHVCTAALFTDGNLAAREIIKA